MMVVKTRVSYHKDVRAEAKAAGKGLLTISLTMPNGERLEEQMVAGVDDCRFCKWIMTVLFCEEVKSLPDVQQIIRRAINEQEK